MVLQEGSKRGQQLAGSEIPLGSGSDPAWITRAGQSTVPGAGALPLSVSPSPVTCIVTPVSTALIYALRPSTSEMSSWVLPIQPNRPCHLLSLKPLGWLGVFFPQYLQLASASCADAAKPLSKQLWSGC